MTAAAWESPTRVRLTERWYQTEETMLTAAGRVPVVQAEPSAGFVDQLE